MSSTRRATVRVALDDPDYAAAAVRPDDTPEIDTRTEDGAVVVTVERDTTGGLRATVDDAVVNLDVAARTLGHVRRHFGGTTRDTEPDDTDTDETTSDTRDTNHE